MASDQKVKVLSAVKPMSAIEVVAAVRGHYVSGSVDGQPVAADCDEPEVARDSERRP